LNNYHPEKKELFILEGMTDSLTAEGLLSSSIGLVSAGTDINLLKAFHKKHTLIVIPDKDAAGDGMISKMEEAGIVF
jgi:5S rRNA maturation endonuclease (ribonuclease M5)